LSTYDCKTANEPALVITTCRSTALIVKIYTHTSPFVRLCRGWRQFSAVSFKLSWRGNLRQFFTNLAYLTNYSIPLSTKSQ